MRRFGGWLGAAVWCLALSLFVWPAAARAGGSVYVTNSGSDNISQYAIGAGGGLSSLSPATVATGTSPAFVAVTGRSVYVTSLIDNTVSQYSVDALSGGLSPKTPATVATGASPADVAVTPDGKSAYVADFFSDAVSQYSIDPLTGGLSPKNPATIAAGAQPVGVAVTPDGNSVYVTNEGDSTVSQYSIDPLTGALSPKTSATVAAGTTPFGVAVSPDGKSAYVTNVGIFPASMGTILQYTINPLTGALSPKTPATVTAGRYPDGIAVTSDGKNAYVTNFQDSTVSQYSIDPLTGGLSPKTPATVAAGTAPPGNAGGQSGVGVTPDGKSAYVTNEFDNTVSQYDINPATGGLAPKSPGAVAAGSGPDGIAVRPPRVPTNKDQCKNGGWRTFPQFKNQGDCVSFVENGK